MKKIQIVFPAVELPSKWLRWLRNCSRNSAIFESQWEWTAINNVWLAELQAALGMNDAPIVWYVLIFPIRRGLLLLGVWLFLKRLFQARNFYPSF
jgi:hypothetical protein